MVTLTDVDKTQVSIENILYVIPELSVGENITPERETRLIGRINLPYLAWHLYDASGKWEDVMNNNPDFLYPLDIEQSTVVLV